MSGPIIRKYGFPNHDHIFGTRPLEHGADEDPTSAEPAREEPTSTEPAKTTTPSKKSAKPKKS
jgi:hypothetical protein